MHGPALLIFGSVGNTPQPFARFLDALAAWTLRDSVKVRVQAGPLARRAWPFPAFDVCTRDEFDHEIRMASLVVASAGFGIVSTCARLERPVILFPRCGALGEHVNDHQRRFAEGMRGRAGIGVAESLQELASEARRLIATGAVPVRGDGAKRTAAEIERFLARNV